MFVQWDYASSTVVGVPSNVMGSTGTWLPCTMPPIRVSAAQQLMWEVVATEHGDHLVGHWVGSTDAGDAIATLEQINTKHRELEIMPVEVLGILLDADERSEARISNSINAFDALPEEPGLVEVVNGTKVIYWKDANNESHPLTKEALVLVFTELIQKRSIRAARLFGRLQAIKATLGQHTINQINSVNYWLM